MEARNPRPNGADSATKTTAIIPATKDPFTSLAANAVIKVTATNVDNQMTAIATWSGTKPATNASIWL